MKKVLVLLPLLVLSFAVNAFAATQTVPYMGTTTIAPAGDKYQAANVNNPDDYWVSLVVGGADGQVIWYSADVVNQTWNEIGRSSTPSANIVAPPGANAFKIQSLSGGEIYMVSGVTNYNDVIWEGKTSNNDQVLNDILNSTNANGEKLGEILNQIKTTSSVSMGTVPAAPDVSAAGRIEKNKPAEKPVFKDDGTYFSDGGNASDVAGPLPGVPDVADWDGMTRQPDGAAEGELTKDGENVKDGELGKDGELVPDVFNQDGEKGKDGELVPDVFNQDGELGKDGELLPDVFTQDQPLPFSPMSPTENYSSTNNFGQTYFYNQTEFYQVTE